MQLSVALQVASSNGGGARGGAGGGARGSFPARSSRGMVRVCSFSPRSCPLAARWCSGCLCLQDQVQDTRSTTKARENTTTSLPGPRSHQPVCLSPDLPEPSAARFTAPVQACEPRAGPGGTSTSPLPRPGPEVPTWSLSTETKAPSRDACLRKMVHISLFESA